MTSRWSSTAVDMVAACLRHVAAAAAGLLTIPLIGHGLGAEALGAWALLGTSSFLLGIADLGLGVVVQRATVSGDRDAIRRAVGLTLTVVGAMGPLLAVLVTLGLLDFPPGPVEAQAERAAVLVVLAGLVQAWGSPYRSLLVAAGQLRSLVLARMGSSLVQVATTAIGLMVVKTLLAPAGALLLAALVEAWTWVRSARARDPLLPVLPVPPACRSELVGPLREGAASLTINAAGLVALRLDVMLLAQVTPLAAVAAYTIASRAVDQSFTVAKQVSAALMPRLGDPAARAQAVRTGTAVLGALVASGMAVLTVTGAPLLVAWAGPAATDPTLAVALPILAAAAWIAAHHETAASSLMLSGRSGWDVAVPLSLGYLLNFVLSAGLVWSLGVWAVAGGTLVGTALSSLLLWRRARALLGWSLGAVGRSLAPGLAATAVALTLSIGLHEPATAGWMASTLVCAAGGLAGLGAAAITARRVA